MDRNSMIKRIWGLSKQKGMDSDDLHNFIEGYTNKDSIKKLSDAQLNFIISKLSGQSHLKVIKTFNQDEYLFHLIETIKDKFSVKDIDAYLNAICRKQFKCDYSSSMDSRKKSKLIGILKCNVGIPTTFKGKDSNAC